MSRKTQCGVIALARSTFDMEFAEDMKNHAFHALDQAGIKTFGSRSLVCDADVALSQFKSVSAEPLIDYLLILQVTFTDAATTLRICRESRVPVVFWGFPEPRIGGRLRLNSFCGINLAAHALGKANLGFNWLFANPEDKNILTRLEQIGKARNQGRHSLRLEQVEYEADLHADKAVCKLGRARITVIGAPPEGFDTCHYNAKELANLTGVAVNTVALEHLFSNARSVESGRVQIERDKIGQTLKGVDALNQEQLDRSLRLYCALQDMTAAQKADGLAVRCWPEVFVQNGCAACGPMAMMNQACVPSACEADVYGSVSTLMLQELAGEPAWMADLVDVDEEGDTAVMWHCGLAPLSMCDPEFEPEATIHTNRKMPLLHQFPLKRGRVTLARVSQAKNRHLMLIAGGEIQHAPMAFTGTSAVIRFDAPVGDVCRAILDEGLEHHFSLVYGDYVHSVRQVANRLNIPVLQLT